MLRDVNIYSPSFTENEKNTVEKSVSTPGMSIYFEAYLYSTGNYSNSTWQLFPSALLVSQQRPSTANEEEDEERDSPSEGTLDKVKKPKKVFCYLSPKVSLFHWKTNAQQVMNCTPGNRLKI